MVDQIFSLTGRNVVVTGGAGLLGLQHCKAIAAAGGIPLIVDHDERALAAAAHALAAENLPSVTYPVDVLDERAVSQTIERMIASHGRIWGLVNNVAYNPPMSSLSATENSLESLAVERWDREFNVGLRSAFLFSRGLGDHMAAAGSGVLVHVASDLARIAPDQRVYLADGRALGARVVKPITYSTHKAGMLGLSRYLATYWAPVPVRSNALLPGSVLSTQSPDLRAALEARIPLGRLADAAEYQGALVFLLSDASSYMTGSELIIDGGRSAW